MGASIAEGDRAEFSWQIPPLNAEDLAKDALDSFDKDEAYATSVINVTSVELHRFSLLKLRRENPPEGSSPFQGILDSSGLLTD